MNLGGVSKAVGGVSKAVGGVSKAAQLFWKHLKIDLQNHMAYRTNFLFNMVGMAFQGVLVPFAVLVIYNVSSGIPGWTYAEFLFLYGTNYVVWGVAMLLFEMMVYRVEWSVKSGEFDMVLLRPIRTSVFISVSNPHIDGIPAIVLGAGLIAFAFPSISFGLGSIAPYLLLCMCGLGVLYSISLMLAAAAVKFVQIRPLYAFYWTLSDFTDYPLNIFSSEILFFFTFLFPLGMVSFYPASFFLGRSADPWLLLGLVSVSGFFLGFSSFLFKRALGGYTSAGG